MARRGPNSENSQWYWPTFCIVVAGVVYRVDDKIQAEWVDGAWVQWILDVKNPMAMIIMEILQPSFLRIGSRTYARHWRTSTAPVVS